MAGLNYTADFEKTEQSFEVVPAGDYTAIIEGSDYVPNKAGDGKILKLTYQIIDGPLKGRKIFNNLNLENKSQKAVEISQQSLNSIMKACNVPTLQDSNQLHNIPMLISVAVKEDATYGKQNSINKHTGLSGTTTSAPTQTKTTPVNAGVDNNNAQTKHPWEK